MSVPMPEGLKLNEFGSLLWDAFGTPAYHVGSSLKKKRGWRDVDVRLILSDEEWAAMSLGNPDNPHTNAKWRAFVFAFTELGRKMTGLPIDFQIQQQSDANKNFSPKDGHLRSALVVVPWRYEQDRPSPHPDAQGGKP